MEQAPQGQWTPLILGFWTFLAVYFLVTGMWVWLLIVAVNLGTEIYNTRTRAAVSYAATAGGLEVRVRGKRAVAVPYGDILAMRKHVNNSRTRTVLTDFGVYRQPKAYPATGLGGARWLLLYRDPEDGRDLPIFFEPSRKFRDLLRRRIYQAIEESPVSLESEGPEPDSPNAGGDQR